MRLVLATRNPHKLRELAVLLEPHELVPLPDEVELPPETGETFAENALEQGARGARAPPASRAIADDSGIAAAALGGAPGVRSARYAGEHATDEDEPREAAARRPERRRPPRGLRVRARLRRAERTPRSLFEGRCEGTLAVEPRGSGGFGYDPAFVPDDYRRRPHDGRAAAGREGRDQPPRPRRARVPRLARERAP